MFLANGECFKRDIEESCRRNGRTLAAPVQSGGNVERQLASAVLKLLLLDGAAARAAVQHQAPTATEYDQVDGGCLCACKCGRR